MSEKYEVVYPVKIDGGYLVDSGIEKNGASHGNVLAAYCGPYPQCSERLHAIADALNRIPQLEAENERLRKRCEELEALDVSRKLDLLRKAKAAPPGKPPPDWCPLPNHDPRSVAVEYLSHLASTEEDDVVACEINRVVERILQEGV